MQIRNPQLTNIVVIGMGYVGIPCAALLADVDGFHVYGVQRRSHRSGWKIECLNSGRSPFEGDEPGLDELIRRVAVEKGTFKATDDYSVVREAEVVLIDVQTPTDEHHVPDYTSLREATRRVGENLRPGALVIIESTVAPGTTEHVVQPILEEASGLQAGRDFGLAFSYERVMPGKLLEYITDMPRVVGGIDEESTGRAVELYRHIVKKKIMSTDVLTAEMAKVVENAYRDVNIAFANEVALVCEGLGIDAYVLRELINARHDRHMHVPGAGVGGHCLPKDPWLLIYGVHNHGRSSAGHPGEPGRADEPLSGLELVELARRINDRMPHHMVDLVGKALAESHVPLSSSRVAVLGVAYLEDADDTRNTPAVPIIRALQALGADVIAHDPYVTDREWQLAWGGEAPVPLVSDLDTALDGADCAVLVTKHTAYVDLGAAANPSRGGLARIRERMRTPVLVDGRNALDGRVCAEAGLVYWGLGKGRPC